MSQSPSDVSAWGYLSSAEAVVEGLARAGLRQVFAEPSATGELLETLRASRLELVVATRAGGSLEMADAQARTSGQPAAALVGADRGLSGVVPHLAVARLDSVPLLVLVALAPGEPADPADLVSSCADACGRRLNVCKGAFVAQEPEEVPRLLAQALQLCRSGEPGPVALLLPAPLLVAKGWMRGTGFKLPPRPLDDGTRRGLERQARRLDDSRQPLIYAGAGCRHAVAELEQLAAHLQAPVLTSLSGLGVLSAQNPWFAGFGPPPACHPGADAIVAACDLVLAVGCHLYPGAFEQQLAEQALLLLDAEPAAPPGLPAAACLSVPARPALRYLLEHTRARQEGELEPQLLDLKRRWKRALRSRPAWSEAVDPVKVFWLLRDLLEAEDVLVLDAGRHTAYGVAAYLVQHAGSLALPVGCAAQGWAVGAGVGVALARAGHRVVACCGESGLVQAAGELLTARRCQVNPVLLLFSELPQDTRLDTNGRLLLRADSAWSVPVDAEALARSLGTEYLRVSQDAELEEGLRQALTREAPVLVELRVRYPEAQRAHPSLGAVASGRLPRPLALRMTARAILDRLLEQGPEQD